MAHATTLITKIVTLKYSGSNGVREHILRMNDMASQLKGLDIEISEGLLVHFIMTSLPTQFGPFKINYNTQKEKWKMSELISMCVQKEERLQSEQPDSAHVAITGPSKGEGKGKKFGKGSVQGNKSAFITKIDKASSSGTKGSVGPRCHFCKDKGHMRKECHKFREWLKKKGNDLDGTELMKVTRIMKMMKAVDRSRVISRRWQRVVGRGVFVIVVTVTGHCFFFGCSRSELRPERVKEPSSSLVAGEWVSFCLGECLRE
ncbi:hypothetical protein RJ639_012149 [Escallonia herrerae]|uniref:CCHC-type domain-containing protein n=1 Tax=Escallonia herrerae TaxID=1293975 RepID=A0AA89ARA7_9ASTE|nr:hypothetical protein RJ639_012149 [Escallonia herrerae]